MRPLAIVGLGCGLWAATALAAVLLEPNTLMAAAAAAVIAELGGGKLGVSWNPPRHAATSLDNARVVGRGFGFGLAAALTVLAAARVLHQVSGASARAPLWLALAGGLFETALVVCKLEILQRGVLRVLCNQTERRAFVPLAVLVGALCSLGPDPWAVLASACLAGAMALLWELHDGALLPIAAHTTFRFLLGTLASSTGLGLTVNGAWVGRALDRGPLAALACVALCALVVSRMPRRSTGTLH